MANPDEDPAFTKITNLEVRQIVKDIYKLYLEAPNEETIKTNTRNLKIRVERADGINATDETPTDPVSNEAANNKDNCVNPEQSNNISKAIGRDLISKCNSKGKDAIDSGAKNVIEWFKYSDMCMQSKKNASTAEEKSKGLQLANHSYFMACENEKHPALPIFRRI